MKEGILQVLRGRNAQKLPTSGNDRADFAQLVLLTREYDFNCTLGMHYTRPISYLTLEVEITDGKVVSREPGKIPDRRVGLLTILQVSPQAIPSKTPLLALEALQEHLKPTEPGATDWMTIISEGRR